MVQKTHNLLQTILKPLPLPDSPDGNLRFGDKVCIHHVPTKSLVSAYMSTFAAHEATCLQPSSPVASSQSLVPCTRNIFVVNRSVVFQTAFKTLINVFLCSYDKQVNVGDVVRYGEKVTLSTLADGVGGGLYLHSATATFMKCAKHSRQQEVLLMDTITYDVAW